MSWAEVAKDIAQVVVGFALYQLAYYQGSRHGERRGRALAHIERIQRGKA